MKNRIKYGVTLLLSICICIGTLYALYTDLNYFLTKKEGSAEILKVNETRDRKPFYVHLRYHNDFINKMTSSTINVGKYDAQKIMDEYKRRNEISIFYAKDYPDKIYVADINAPRWLILVFEVSMITIMIFSIYACIKALRRK